MKNQKNSQASRVCALVVAPKRKIVKKQFTNAQGNYYLIIFYLYFSCGIGVHASCFDEENSRGLFIDTEPNDDPDDEWYCRDCAPDEYKFKHAILNESRDKPLAYRPSDKQNHMLSRVQRLFNNSVVISGLGEAIPENVPILRDFTKLKHWMKAVSKGKTSYANWKKVIYVVSQIVPPGSKGPHDLGGFKGIRADRYLGGERRTKYYKNYNHTRPDDIRNQKLVSDTRMEVESLMVSQFRKSAERKSNRSKQARSNRVWEKRRSSLI